MKITDMINRYFPLLFLSIVTFSIKGTAQNIGIGTNVPNNAAILELSSTSKGLLPPRMTISQRSMIVSPEVGLIVFCTDCGTNGIMTQYNGSGWVNLAAAFSLPPTTLPEVFTEPVAATSITTSSAVATGGITSNGNAPSINAKGIVWSIYDNPTLAAADQPFAAVGGVGYSTSTDPSFILSDINGLSQNTTYKIRSFATNAKGTAYGNQQSFKTKQLNFTTQYYDSVLQRIYGSLAYGSPEIAGGLDQLSHFFIRGYFNLQELPTDEAVVSWSDQTIQDFHALSWTSQDPYLKSFYTRLLYNIALANEYIRESSDSKLSERGISGPDALKIRNSVFEVRFLRAFNYWVMMDIFGKSTFITEADLYSATNSAPERSRSQLFSYITAELLDIEGKMARPKSLSYGRADQSAAWALLARIYLNAQVYAGVSKYNEALTYAKKVIDAGFFSLHQNYAELFMADNDKRTNELIFAIKCDGKGPQVDGFVPPYGNTTTLIHAAAGSDNMDYGVSGGWFGYRSTKGLADKFLDLTGQTDRRALFTTSVYGVSPAQIEINDIRDFNNGLHVKKYVNIRSDGAAVSDPALEFSDVDFPVFRLAEMYLIYAEATLRGGTGNINLAVSYINNLRTRAYGNNSGNVNVFDLQFVLDERARELYWEGHRRTDLVRYNLLTTGTYLWPWKGGISTGTAVDNKYNIFPVPAYNLTANPNLTQNTGY